MAGWDVTETDWDRSRTRMIYSDRNHLPEYTKTQLVFKPLVFLVREMKREHRKPGHNAVLEFLVFVVVFWGYVLAACALGFAGYWLAKTDEGHDFLIGAAQAVAFFAALAGIPFAVAWYFIREKKHDG